MDLFSYTGFHNEMNYDDQASLASGGAGYVDPFKEYKTVCSRLTKRFLRKPNLAEASRSFASLTHKFAPPPPHEDIDPGAPTLHHYAGACQLAVARMEHGLGNVSGEAGGLREAGRHFIAAQLDASRQLGGPPQFGEHGACAAHCYGHAIRVHLQHNETPLAGELALELGLRNYELSTLTLPRPTAPDEAFHSFERASRLLRDLPSGKMTAYRWMIAICVENGRYNHALELVDSLSNYFQRVMSCDESEGFTTAAPTQVSDAKCNSVMTGKLFATLLEELEVSTVLVLLKLRLLDKQMKPEHSRLLARYCDPSVFSIKNNSAPDTNIRVHHELPLLLHSFCSALRGNTTDISAATTSLNALWPYLNRMQRHLGLCLVDELTTGLMDDFVMV